MFKPLSAIGFLTAAVFLFPSPVSAQDAINVSAKELRQYIGKRVTVEGKAVETASTKDSREEVELFPQAGFSETVYLYFERRTPFEAFFAVVTGNASRANHRFWRNKHLRVTGMVIDGPSGRRIGIVVDHPDDLVDLDAEKP